MVGSSYRIAQDTASWALRYDCMMTLNSPQQLHATLLRQDEGPVAESHRQRFPAGRRGHAGATAQGGAQRWFSEAELVALPNSQRSWPACSTRVAAATPAQLERGLELY